MKPRRPTQRIGRALCPSLRVPGFWQSDANGREAAKAWFTSIPWLERDGPLRDALRTRGEGVTTVRDRFGSARVVGSVIAVMLLVVSGAARTDGSSTFANDAECENYDPDWSPDGRSLAFVRSCAGSAELYLVDADGTNLVRLTETPGREGSPAWSPDGQRLAYVYTPESADREIWIMAPDGSDARPVTDNESSEASPTWSPDGERLAYESVRNDNADIWVLDLTSRTETRLTRSPARDVGPSWSPDGGTIAFQSNREGRYVIYGVTPEGDEIRPLVALPGDAVIPDWSPDGSSIAFAYRAEGSEHIAIWVAAATGGDPRPVIEGERTAFFPKWSPDGDEIAFMVRQDAWDIFVVSVDGTGERRLLPASEP